LESLAGPRQTLGNPWGIIDKFAQNFGAVVDTSQNDNPVPVWQANKSSGPPAADSERELA